MSMFDLENRAKPVLKWAGGKSGILHDIVANFPNQFERYFEPFLGGAAVFLALEKRVPVILNELNPEIVNMYRVVRDFPGELMVSLDVHESLYSEEYYYAVRAMKPTNFIEMAARTVFLNKTGFNGLYRQNSKGEFNVPFGKRSKCPALYVSSNLFLVSEKLRGIEFMNGDFELALAHAREGDFVYCDPPYEPVSRTSSFNSYTHTGFSQADQTRLHKACELAVRRGATVAVSNSAASFIKTLYVGWDVRMVKANRAINSRGDSRGAVDEVLVLMRG